MSKISKNIQLGGMIVVVIMAVLLLSFIFGWIDAEQLKDTFVKAVASVLVVLLASIAIVTIAGSDLQP